jgi:aryl-alcohol dehydrogenase-like predicted oxidoreductase
MRYNFLGNTGVLVSELCFGTMTFSGQGFWAVVGKQGQEEANELLKASVDAGINFIDTANVYSMGESEKILGESIKALGLNRHDLVIASKVKGRMTPAVNNVGLSRLQIHRSVDESLQRLGMDHMDILYIHGFDTLTPIEETMRGLNEVVNAGKVRYLGVCNTPAWVVMKANGIAERNGWHKFDAMQYYYSAASRDIERELIPLAQSEKIGMMPWSPLAGGFLSGKYTRDTPKAGDSRRDDFDFPLLDKEKAYNVIDALISVGKRHDVSAARVALAWVIQQPGITSTIIGAKNLTQLEDNLSATQLVLTPEDILEINTVSGLTPEYPGWMVEFQMRDRLPGTTRF